MAPTLEQFVDNLNDCGLLTADEVSAAQSGLPADQLDSKSLATYLVRQQKLTKYQAAAIFQGKHQRLKFGEYVVKDKIGEGGMGIVLRAEHQRMKRTVAIKVLPTRAMKSEEAIQRFYREVEAAAKLSHPHIVHAYDASEHDGWHYLVMEHVDGQDLAAVINSQGPLPIAAAVSYIKQAAEGLEYAHKRGVIHRDIKPANLLLDKEGVVKILDLGLARFSVGGNDETGPEELTGSGQIMGTVDYMAPEQAADTRRADARSDIYSLGCSLYRLLTGQPVFPGESVMNRLLAHQNNPIPLLREVRPDVPPLLDEIYQRMIAKSPDDRPQSMREVIDLLEGSLQGVPAFDDAATQKLVSPSVPIPLSQDQASQSTHSGANVDPTVDFSINASPRPTMSSAGRKSKGNSQRMMIILGAVGVGGVGLLVFGLLVATSFRSSSEPSRPAAPPVSDSTMASSGDSKTTPKFDGDFVDTVWKVSDSSGDKYEFHFLGGGVLHYDAGRGLRQNGTWHLQENKIEININNQFALLKGTLAVDGKLSGNGSSINGTAWTWTATQKTPSS